MSCRELKLERNFIVNSIPNQCKPRLSSILLHPKIQHSLRVQRLSKPENQSKHKNLPLCTLQAVANVLLEWSSQRLINFHINETNIYTLLCSPTLHHGVAQMQRQLVKEGGSRNVNPSKGRAVLWFKSQGVRSFKLLQPPLPSSGEASGRCQWRAGM